MFLKLIDEHGTPKLVNLANAQSIEKYVDEEEDNPIFANGIRIIWNDQILKDGEMKSENDTAGEYYYSEQVFFGISITGLEQLLIKQSLLVPPAQQIISDQSEKTTENGQEELSKLAPDNIQDISKEESSPDPEPETPAAPVETKAKAPTKKAPAKKTTAKKTPAKKTAKKAQTKS